ncbi:hypothetical protein RSAG8_06016, partial [Rhizoctonia solani AG-8 WAC10335]
MDILVIQRRSLLPLTDCHQSWNVTPPPRTSNGQSHLTSRIFFILFCTVGQRFTRDFRRLSNSRPQSDTWR